MGHFTNYILIIASIVTALTIIIGAVALTWKRFMAFIGSQAVNNIDMADVDENTPVGGTIHAHKKWEKSLNKTNECLDNLEKGQLKMQIQLAMNSDNERLALELYDEYKKKNGNSWVKKELIKKKWLYE